jgi:glutathione S-transferase
VMPRPDLALLPVSYRRIPLLAIHNDIYLDTRMILRALEDIPSTSAPRLGAASPADQFIEKLIEKYIIEGPAFGMAAGLVPVDMAQDPTFNKDRQGMLGRTWTREELEGGRAECLNYIRNMFDFYETTVLKDGRKWMLGGDGPKLADIEGMLHLSRWVDKVSLLVGCCWAGHCLSVDGSLHGRIACRVLVGRSINQRLNSYKIVGCRGTHRCG